jgi:two-component system CheB/CheR fusion protein
VGVGASAGGLDAFKRFLEAIPSGGGMAYVLIQHLDPAHPSMMADLLTGHTSMKVLQAVDGAPLEPDHVYLIPPGTYLSVKDRALRLSEPRERHGARTPIDFFLYSLATECGPHAMCVILSGTGADGSLGLKAIKAGGGLVVAQDPEEAAFDGMPRSAIGSGCVDLVLPVAEIPQALFRYGRRNHPAGITGQAADALDEIIALMSAKTAHDFSNYKRGTLQRRVERRMAMAGVKDCQSYAARLRADSDELHRLAEDLLINVTQFFRDAAAFDFLAATIVPELTRRLKPDIPVRIWVPGCSTGEEAYSLAMLFIEEITAAKQTIKLQIIASDVVAEAVALARIGVYPETIEANVTPARLARFFHKENNTYRVTSELREVVVFTAQDLLTDAPFSRLDLISCRNVLIYLQPEAQEKVFDRFHFALRPGGVLFLGRSETATMADGFEPISNEQRIYRRVGRARPGEVDFSAKFPTNRSELGGALRSRTPWPPAPRSPPSLGEAATRMLLEAYAPASVLINARCEGLYFFGSTDRYLQVAPGAANRDVLAMARDGLRSKLRAAIQRASKDNARTKVTGAHVNSDGRRVGVSIVAQPAPAEGEALLLVSFIDEQERHAPRTAETEPAVDASQIALLEQELDATRADLLDALNNLEIANEEHRALYEEAMSVNEEFQSTNEELETSKEELQSLNEELTALNSQLQETVEQQRATSNDLHNILNSSDVATLFLDGALNIRFYTPAAKSLFNVIATDIGRPLADLTRRFDDDDLLADARTVLENLAPQRREVETNAGEWRIRRILPNLDGSRIEGVVITFSDVSEMKAVERELQAARAYSDSIIATVRQSLVVVDEDLRIISASRAFYRMFAVEPRETMGQRLAESSNALNVPAIKGFLAAIQAGGDVEDQEIEIELPALGRRSLLMNAREIREEPFARRKILVAIDDITEAKREGEALASAKLEAERANLGKSRFLAAASHDLRQPLQTISLLQGLLEHRIKDEATLKLVERLDRTVTAMSGTLNKLLDINQLEAGVVRPEIVDFPISDVFERLKTEFVYLASDLGVEWRVVPCSLSVRSDPQLLEQIIRNLLSNAVKYSSKGKLLLGCRRRGDKLSIEVWDTGMGIPAGELQAIFEEFHQLDNPSRERTKGLGLGLAIVQRLAALLGHPIDVRSRLGLGSVFTVEAPISLPGAAHQAAICAPKQADTLPDKKADEPPAGGSILIVEDDPALRETLELLLTGQGYRVWSAADGWSAMEQVAQGAKQPDLVIADYNLPNGLTGIQVASSLQKVFDHPAQIIILTGDISTGTLREIASHPYTHVNKPMKAQELMRVIQRLLAIAQPGKTQPLCNGSTPRPEMASIYPRPTIFVVDDDDKIRETMRELLIERGYAVAAFADVPSFFEAHPGGRGCVLVDAVMPGIGGIELIERLKAEKIDLPAIMITGLGDVPMAVKAMKAGAADFIEKPIGASELLASIERALDRRRDAAQLSVWRQAAVTRVASLTERQREILALVVDGKPSKNIAADLDISQRTVDNHRAAIMRKMGVKSIPELIRLALAATEDGISAL